MDKQKDKQKAQNQGGDCWVLICGLGFCKQAREFMFGIQTTTYVQAFDTQGGEYMII